MILMNESKFNMWRACVAIVYLDQVVSVEEKKWVEEKIAKLPLTDDQRAILINDLEHGVKLSDVLAFVTDKVDLGFLVNIFRVIGNLDHRFSPDEKIAYRALEEKVLKGLDLKKIQAEVVKAEIESYHESEVYKDYNKASVFEHVFHQVMKSMSPGDYKFPK